MVLHVRHVLECSEGNPDLRGDSVELCCGGVCVGRVGIVGGVYQKFHNVLHRLRMGRLMSI